MLQLVNLVISDIDLLSHLLDTASCLIFISLECLDLLLCRLELFIFLLDQLTRVIVLNLALLDLVFFRKDQSWYALVDLWQQSVQSSVLRVHIGYLLQCVQVRQHRILLILDLLRDRVQGLGWSSRWDWVIAVCYLDLVVVLNLFDDRCWDLLWVGSSIRVHDIGETIVLDKVHFMSHGTFILTDTWCACIRRHPCFLPFTQGV
jgi:hypothetical protein